MKGLILNLVEEAVVVAHGDVVWDALLQRSGLEGVWTSLGTYPEDQLPRLLEAGSALLGIPTQELARAAGRHTAQGLAQRYPHYFAPHVGTLAFLRTLDAVVHDEVAKLHPDAAPPRFGFGEVEGPTADGASSMRVHYRSRRRLCWLAVGMIEGTGIVYGERTEVRHEACQLHDAPRCTLRVTTRTG